MFKLKFTAKSIKFSVVSLFYIALILHGLQRISGLFIIELLKESKCITHQDAAIPFIYSWAVSKIVASLADFLIDNKSSKLVAFCGVSLSSIGAALCILDMDITAVTVFWGFIFGSGYGLVLSHIKKDISNNDSSKLSFFKEVPTSFGIIIMSFLLNIIITNYGLQGSLLFFSGTILQYMPIALAAAYHIEIRIPNIKWRVRKKNSQYSVSKEEGIKSVSLESFNSSLEPDFVIEVNQRNDYYHNINRNSPVLFPKETFRIGRKRSETRGKDLQSLETSSKMLQKNIFHYPTIPEMRNCDEDENLSQERFSNIRNTDVETEGEELTTLNSRVTYNVCVSDKSNMNSNESDFNIQNEILKIASQNRIKETESQKDETNVQCLGNSISKDKKFLGFAYIQNTMKQITEDENEYKKNQIIENLPTQQTILDISKQTENAALTSDEFNREKSLDKETADLSPHSLKSKPIFIIPLDIKVHVEEYTFAVDKEYKSNSFDSNYSEDSINYSQSNFLNENEFSNSKNQSASRNIPNNFNDKANLSKIYCISNKQNCDNINPVKSDKAICFNISKDELKLKFIRILSFFNKIISPACLSIVVITIIFETSLITLLTNIGDFTSSTDQVRYDFMWILVAFGVGGLFGKLCCCKISRTISEKIHTVGTILFLLTGLSIAGVLYSPNLNWLAGFYSILGALEGGISYILPKFILDYTHKEVHNVISSMKNFLSGVTIICLPSVLRLLPDEMGDYEFILQTLSCLFILCALLAYFLPQLRSISHKRKVSIF